jgi:hypothetical protein
LWDLPSTFHFLDVQRLGRKVDPLSPSAALPENGYASHAIQQYALIARLATRRLLKTYFS